MTTTVPTASTPATPAPTVPSAKAFRVERLTCSLGAEVHDIDLGQVSRDDAMFAQLRELLVQHKVLFFRDQDITRAEHVALAQRFGPLEGHPVVPSDPDHPGLVRIYKDLDSPAEHFENAFHCDATWRTNPPFGSILRCVESPAVGGDTIWVNMVEAYRRLPVDVKKRIDGLRARHSIEASFGARMSTPARRGLHEKYPDAEHPVVRTHPDTGEKILFVNSFTTHFVNYHTDANVRFGADYAPGAGDLLRYLISQAAVPEYQVRWRWTENSIAIWDNRCTQHYAVQDYWPGVRKMERAGIVGDPTF